MTYKQAPVQTTRAPATKCSDTPLLLDRPCLVPDLALRLLVVRLGAWRKTISFLRVPAHSVGQAYTTPTVASIISFSAVAHPIMHPHPPHRRLLVGVTDLFHRPGHICLPLRRPVSPEGCKVGTRKRPRHERDNHRAAQHRHHSGEGLTRLEPVPPARGGGRLASIGGWRDLAQT
eukprot:CAMPEP_0176039208 /NCGR_PEP_ID=MMETSP0120_2-20121206/19435_1 /TAXON_ID=160619 /ORGANISM="Kryptoperidinium foliaceum, Strain CCMP 1326" /LENGTH=174 /DNA_ID=CAMNT_0017372603 /DNA_START=227 /DNA_END=747 /DNA_ORIENTATION=+